MLKNMWGRYGVADWPEGPSRRPDYAKRKEKGGGLGSGGLGLPEGGDRTLRGTAGSALWLAGRKTLLEVGQRKEALEGTLRKKGTAQKRAIAGKWRGRTQHLPPRNTADRTQKSFSSLCEEGAGGCTFQQVISVLGTKPLFLL